MPTKKQRMAVMFILVICCGVGILAVVLGIAWTARFPVAGPVLTGAGVGLVLASVLVSRSNRRSGKDPR